MRNSKHIIIILCLTIFSNNSFAAKSSDACDMTNENAEICYSQNDRATFLSLKDTELDNSYSNFTDEEKHSASVRLIANTELNKKIKEKNYKISHSDFYNRLVMYSMFFFALTLLIRKVDGQKAFESMKVNLITAFFFGGYFILVVSPYGGFALIEKVSDAIDSVDQKITNVVVDSYDLTNSLKDVDDYKTVEEQIGGLESKYNDSKNFVYALTDFVLSDDKELDYYLEKSPQRWATPEELLSSLLVFSKDDINITYSPYNGDVVTFKKLSKEEQSKQGYISKLGFGASDRYGEISFAPIQITDKVFSNEVDVQQFIADIRSGKSFSESVEEPLSKVRKVLEFNGEIDAAGKRILSKVNFGLADLAKGEMVAKQVQFMIESKSFQTAVNLINDYYCVDNQALVADAYDYINNPSLNNSGRLDCVANKDGELVLLGSDYDNSIYLSDTPVSTFDLRKETTQFELVEELKSLTNLFDNMFNSFYADYIAVEQEIYDSKTQYNMYKSQGLSGLGAFVLTQTLETGKNYYLSLKRPVSVSINSDRYYISTKNLPENEIKEYEVDKLDRLDKKYVNSIITDFVQDRTYKENTYQLAMQNQYDNSFNTDVAYTDAIQQGFKNDMTEISKSIQNIYDFDVESTDMSRIQNFYNFVKELNEKAIVLGDETFNLYLYSSAASLFTDSVNSYTKNQDGKTKVKSSKNKKESKFKLSKATNIVNEVASMSSVLIGYLLAFITVVIFMTTMLDIIVFWSIDYTIAIWSISIFISMITLLNFFMYFPFIFSVGLDENTKLKQWRMFVIVAIRPFYQMFEMFIIVSILPFLFYVSLSLLGLGLDVFNISIDGLESSSTFGFLIKLFITPILVVGYFVFSMKFLIGSISGFIKKALKIDDQFEHDMESAIDTQNFVESMTHGTVSQKADVGFKLANVSNRQVKTMKNSLRQKIENL